MIKATERKKTTFIIGARKSINVRVQFEQTYYIC